LIALNIGSMDDNQRIFYYFPFQQSKDFV
jgi:hypothetical protein